MTRIVSNRTVTANASARSKFLILLTASLVCSLIMLDSNIVAIALPAIGRSLGASFTDIEWVVSAYILSFAALLLAAGSYADRHGRKRGMLIGIFLFATASAACGLANSPLFLNVARAVQGLGGSLLLTAALAVIAQAFDGAERARAYAFWGACLGIAITAGPIVGGVITSYLGWRWVFLVNVPICMALFVATFAIIQESRDDEVKRLDISGIVTFSSGLFLLIWALIDGNGMGWTSGAILLRLAGAGLLLAGFGIAEMRQARPMVDFTLFKRPTFLGSAFAMIGYAAGAQVMIFYLPLFLQNAYGFKPAAAGLAMIPFAVPMFLAPRAGARLASRYSGRTLLTAGLVVTVAGDLLMWAVTRADQPYAVFVVSMLVAGTGAGLLNGETAKVMQGVVPAQRAGMASGIAGTTRFVGLLLGVAGLGAVLAKVASRQFVTAATTLGLDPAIAVATATRVTSGNIAGMPDGVAASIQAQIHAAGLTAFADGFAAASLLAAVVAAFAASLTLALVRAADTAPIRATMVGRGSATCTTKLLLKETACPNPTR
jgi:EmrB/QacA subfamily drug resistance transporter